MPIISVRGDWWELQLPKGGLEHLLDIVGLACYRRNNTLQSLTMNPATMVVFKRSPAGKNVLLLEGNDSSIDARKLTISLGIRQAAREHLEIEMLVHQYDGRITLPDDEDVRVRQDALVFVVWTPEDPEPQIVSALFELRGSRLFFEKIMCLGKASRDRILQSDHVYGNIWEDAKTADLSGVLVRDDR